MSVNGESPIGVHWLSVLIAIYRRGLPQTGIAALSAVFLSFQLSRRQQTTSGKILIQKTQGISFFEPFGPILNVLTLSLFVAAARDTAHSALNGIPLGYVCLLQLARAIGPNENRKKLRIHIDAVLVSTLGLMLVTEGLPLMTIAGKHSLGHAEIRAAASLLFSVCFAILTPHERLTRVDKVLGLISESTHEETCSWIDNLFTCSRANRLFQQANGSLTIDDLDGLPSAYNPELLRRKFSQIRKIQPTTARALVSLLWPQLLLCTVLGVLLATAQLISPMGLHCLLEYMQRPEKAVFQPWLWLTIICAGRTVQSTFQQAYSSYSRKLVAQASAMLTAEVYRSALASRELHENFMGIGDGGSGEESGSKSTASGVVTNLVSSDIRSIMQLQDVLGCVTAIPAAGAAVLGLYQLVGWPCLVGIALALSGSPFESWFMKYIDDHEGQQKTAQDERISLISEYLRAIKIIKYSGWEEVAAENIAQARATEQKHINDIDIFSTGLALIADFFPILSIVSIFGLHVLVGKAPLTASTAYTTVQLLEIIKNCLVFLALESVDFSRALVSLRRFDKFFKSLTPLDIYPNGPVEIQNATFQRAGGATFHLRGINIKFKQDGLNVVSGDSGSGKSTLLLALLGETLKKSGSVTRQADAAYAPQTAWLQAGTIRDNILFFREYDEKRYRTVVAACCLDIDFEEMQHGDQTVIGHGGFALSGGQCARVALARTLFSDASLLLLDDIFSALDTKTSLELWNGVFCSDLLQNRTVILVTQHAWVAQEADVAIAMDNGRVQSVTKKSGYVRETRTIPSTDNVKEDRQTRPLISLSVGKDADVKAKVELVTGEGSPPTASAGPLSVFSYLMYFGGPCIAVLTVATCFFHTGAAIYTNYWMSRWVENAKDSGNSTLYYLVLYIGLSLLTETIDGVRMMAFSRGIWVAARRLHVQVIHAVMAAPLPWFTEQTISNTLNRLSEDISTLDQSIYNSVVPAISDMIRCMLMVGAVATQLPVFILPALALLTIGCLMTHMYDGVNRNLTELVSSSRSPILSDFSEGLAGFMVIRATSTKSAIFHTRMNNLLCASSRVQHAQSNASQWLKFRMSSLATIVNVLAASLALSQNGKMSAGFAGFCLSQATQLSDRIFALILSVNRLSIDMQTFQRVREWTQLPPEKDCVTKSSEDLSESWPRTGAIELRNVTVRYAPDGQDILKNVSLRIEPGERVAIVGRTGSGKSTLILSLLGFTNIESGQILCDGVDIQSIPHKRLRQSVSTIPQEAQLFQGTLASNLDPFGRIPKSELQNALDVYQFILRSVDEAKAAEIASVGSANNDVLTGRLTLSTMVRARGENFSHGQRQVLSLCRVLVRRSKLILLDEATSSMDARTDAGVQQALRAELSRTGGESRTLITVAHRLPTIMDYDRVVVMGSGRILEMGSPGDLLAKRSAFYDMVMHSGEKDLLISES